MLVESVRCSFHGAQVPLDWDGEESPHRLG